MRDGNRYLGQVLGGLCRDHCQLTSILLGMGRNRAMHPRQRVDPYAGYSGHGAFRTSDRPAR